MEPSKAPDDFFSLLKQKVITIADRTIEIRELSYADLNYVREGSDQSDLRAAARGAFPNWPEEKVAQSFSRRQIFQIAVEVMRLSGFNMDDEELKDLAPIDDSSTDSH